ncbi:MAG: trypsin-like peptidase domain-containing protein [Micrococcales bacterium]|nr:trypsin-like peptidase domain-containing protein [Micrococcales bacterium]
MAPPPPHPPGPPAQAGTTTQPPKAGASLSTVWVIALVCALFVGVCSAGTTWWLARSNPSTAGQTSDGSDTLKGLTSGQNTPEVPKTDGGNGPDWVTIAAKVQPTVVAIQTEVDSGYGAQGSGVIINSQKGYIVTNNHVVAGAQRIQAVLVDGRIFAATALGTDPTTDLAVLQLDNVPDDLAEATLGDSDALVVGQSVLAVGNPLGLDNTVTQGIVSALNRPVTTEQAGGAAQGELVVTNAVQVDAAINPGNSGGPLFDADGQVIGINSSIATMGGNGDQTGSIGLAFAIPVNLVKVIAPQLIESGAAIHPLLGVESTDAVVEVAGQHRAGAAIAKVQSGSPAAASGIQAGDVIYAVDGRPVNGSLALTATIRSRSPGSDVTISLVRDGQPLDITATLSAKDG